MSRVEPEQTPDERPAPEDLVPDLVRTWAYGIGTVCAAVAVAAPEPVSRYLAAIATAALGLAFGYRPTR
jgi:hypothetical protein